MASKTWGELARDVFSRDCVVSLDPARILPPSHLRWRVEQSFSGPDFQALKESVANAGGNVQPIKVGAGTAGAADMLIFGSRRLRACLELGLPVLAWRAIDCSLRQAVLDVDASNPEASAIERGTLYATALDAGVFPSSRRLAEHIGREFAAVNLAARLATLPGAVLAVFADPRSLTTSDARRLLRAFDIDPAGVAQRAGQPRMKDFRADGQRLAFLLAKEG